MKQDQVCKVRRETMGDRFTFTSFSPGKFRVKTEAEQQIWNECSRLIANAIIYYDRLLLIAVYEQKVATANLGAIKFIKGTSPVAWRNFNLIGNFDFTTSSSPDIDALAAHYENEDFWCRSMQEGEDDGIVSDAN